VLKTTTKYDVAGTFCSVCAASRRSILGQVLGANAVLCKMRATKKTFAHVREFVFSLEAVRRIGHRTDPTGARSPHSLNDPGRRGRLKRPLRSVVLVSSQSSNSTNATRFSFGLRSSSLIFPPTRFFTPCCHRS